MRKIRLYPAANCRRTIAAEGSVRLLTAFGAFDSRRGVYWHPIQSHLLSNRCITEANSVFRALRKDMLHDLKSMRRACAEHPDAMIDGHWCATYDFAISGRVNDYRLRCMISPSDLNFVFTVYEKSTNEKKEAA